MTPDVAGELSSTQDENGEEPKHTVLPKIRLRQQSFRLGAPEALSSFLLSWPYGY